MSDDTARESSGHVPTHRHRVTVAEAMERLPGPGGVRFAEVLEHGSLVVEIYAPRGTDPQTPHTRGSMLYWPRTVHNGWSWIEPEVRLWGVLRSSPWSLEGGLTSV